jgi:hypothetical protein
MSDQAWFGTPSGSTFKNNTVKMDSGGGFFWFEGITSATITGNTFWDTRNPTTQCSYFQSGSSGNNITGNTFKTKYQYNASGDYTPCMSISSDSSVNLSGNTYLGP